MTYQLGIDTGGTYTDAVIVDTAKRIIAKCKSLTTPFDLTEGIEQALDGLSGINLQATGLVALSTTLSTNSVVEGRGSPVGVILAGYKSQQVEQSGLTEILEDKMISIIDGGHGATGEELVPLDEARLGKLIAGYQGRVSAFAVSSIFSIRNPEHEIRIREKIYASSGKPVACGHELSNSLGAPRRALTAAMNARMLLYIQELIDSVERILARKLIRAPLMIVKGDGSLVSAQVARKYPVSTVLSGPAASVIGACALSGKKDAIVVDMGGTTTDICVVSKGRPDLCHDGARIGNWQPMVEAIRVFSIGLGGDSELRFKAGLEISERRIVPISLLAYQYPRILDKLYSQYHSGPTPLNNRFALQLQMNRILIDNLDPVEREVWESLGRGPVELDYLASTDRMRLRALARLERLGLVVYSGFTPSDATHVLGMSQHWNPEAAIMGAKIWARQMRHLYGFGDWKDDDAVTPSQRIFDAVTRKISQKLIEAGLHQLEKLSETQTGKLTNILADIILNPQFQGSPKPLFELGFSRNHSVIAVGGPARDYFPDVSKRLGVSLELPEHGEVANAVGAALGAVVQTSQINVTQPEFGMFYLFHKGQPMRFSSLQEAVNVAENMAREEAENLAIAAGADGIETSIEHDANHIKHDIDGELFVSTTVTAVATGHPKAIQAKS
ncbi:MAG: hydantoinase/oxoprolinase family protein [Gammaproteobacteria bacterium]|nr:hydantoinase/oxoprolinase family protein [Gammaproteobacteria bacterium]